MLGRVQSSSVFLSVVTALFVTVMADAKPVSLHSKQGGWLEDPDAPASTTSTYSPPARTGVIEPDGSTVWKHGETGVEVSWRGLPDNLYKLELYRNGTLVTQLSSWLEGVSSFTKTSPVLTSWGSGGGFQVKLIDDLGNEYWSDEFQIRSNVEVTTPNAFSCWSTGTVGTAVAWDGCQGNTVKLELFRNGNRVGDYSGWVANSGEYLRQAPIPSEWGSGTGYSLRIIDDQGNEGESERFEIGNIPVALDGNTVTWTGGLGAVKIELFDGTDFIADLSGWIDNSGSFSLQNASLPTGYHPGRGTCRIRVSDRRDSFGWAGGSSFSVGGSAPVAGMEFVSIPGGSFYMGSPSSESGRGSDEARHRVTVGAFELMTTEVTQGMWLEVMGSNPSYFTGDLNRPVEKVFWNDCQEFIDRLNDMDPSHTYRLPSESEWEYACRAGTTTRFYWGDSESTMGRYCWYTENSNSTTHPVAQTEPNAWGLYDMSGNVWEWCEDKYTSDYDDCPTDGRAYTGSGSDRVGRGGSWSLGARYCRSAYRLFSSPGGRFNSLGFRVARSV